MTFLALFLCLWLLWRLYQYQRTAPEVFSKENIHKSLWTLGLLVLALILLLSVVVMILK